MNNLPNGIFIIMYHYVRPIKESNIPNLKGLELSGFKRQIEYFAKNFDIITPNQALNYIQNYQNPDKPSVWLTFDDGYKDHYRYVYPTLKEYGLLGSFFPVANSLYCNNMLPVNAIHLILAKAKIISELPGKLDNLCQKNGITVKTIQTLRNKYFKNGRFDCPAANYVKRVLQKGLPNNLRQSVLSEMFFDVLGTEINTYADDFYLTPKEVQEMYQNQMQIGNHTFSHPWLNTLEINDQILEIEKSETILESIIGKQSKRVMCYPYGGYDNNTLKLMDTMNFNAALTTLNGRVDLAKLNEFELPRFDTNEFPQ
jgi:peptidoglycan/xylan/chitin deacetylase (PgdA/CDA1 family)